jgi:hypothetical protein
MKKDNNYLIIFTAITFIWAGMVLGISFLEAPLKFQAPNITLALGVGIGRLVFSAFNKFEIFFMISLWILGILCIQRNYQIIISISLLTLILAAQTFWLLPALDERAVALIAAKIPERDSPHIYYIILEGIKLASLIVLGIISSNQMLLKKYHE